MAENIMSESMESDVVELYSRTEYSDTETSEEEMGELSGSEREREMAKCESCVRDKCPWYKDSCFHEGSRSERFKRASQLYGRVAVFLCFVCEMYVCGECMPRHRGHDGMKVERKESERMGEQRERERNKKKGQGKENKRMGLEVESEKKNERERKDRANERITERIHAKKLWDNVMNETEIESEKKFKTNKASIIDRVNVQHELDQEGDCKITGLCGLENKRWVACDCWNSCIKIFRVESHVLQRYIWFVESRPWDVTEIHFKQNSAEPNLVSGSSSDISATDRADPNKQCLIAVTLPWKHQIMFTDISKIPPKQQKVIHTEGECRSIQFYDDNIFTVCREYLDSPWSVYIQDTEGRDSTWYVYIISTDGVTLNKFDTGVYYPFPGPYLAVVSERVYIADVPYHKVQWRNVEGQVISEFPMVVPWPTGISVDPDNNVYVCASGHDKVYKLDADLTRYKSVLDQTTGYIERPDALCWYRDKLFISHFGSPSLGNFVTAVRLL